MVELEILRDTLLTMMWPPVRLALEVLEKANRCRSDEQVLKLQNAKHNFFNKKISLAIRSGK